MRLFPTPQLQRVFVFCPPEIPAFFISTWGNELNGPSSVAMADLFQPVTRWQYLAKWENHEKHISYNHNPRYDHPLCDHLISIYHNLIISKWYISIHCVVHKNNRFPLKSEKMSVKLIQPLMIPRSRRTGFEMPLSIYIYMAVCQNLAPL